MSRQRSNTAGWAGHGDLEASLVLIFPVLLAYEVGVLFGGRVNGADVITRLLYTLLGSKTLYLLVHAVVALWFLLWARARGKWGTLRMEIVAPVVLEAAIYALTLGAVVNLVLEKLLGLGVGRESIISALGAGVHEEIVFRLGLFAGLTSLLESRQQRFAMPVALIVSSIAFAAAHHLGAHGEPFTMHAFAFRALAGAAFGAIFWYRSLAHAVYAHVLYDLVVVATS
ncbi:MAG TPA: CPBP family intramembrane glutamic endopeptidase [Kofleriaceae bacterium]|nr:CPBP family intramembrane glutamic endopeptidase [Kofleriaceae bacterium]